MKDFGCFNLVSWNLSQGHLSDVPRQQCYAKAPSHTRPQVLGTVWKKRIFDDSKRVFNRLFILKSCSCALVLHIISHHYAGYMFAPNVERLLWRAVNWNATNLFTRGRNRSSALSRAVERDSRSTSTWGHTCAFILEIAPTSAPSRYWTGSKVIIRQMNIIVPQGCNKKFAQSTNLKSHILTHAKQKSGRGSVSSPDSVSGSHSNLDSHRWPYEQLRVLKLIAVNNFENVCNISQSNLNCSLDVSNATHILSDSGLSLQTQFVQVTFHIC